MISRRILAALLVLCAIGAGPAIAQNTKAQINTQIGVVFPDNGAGLITPAALRAVTSNIVNSIMPTAPVTSGNLTCFNGTTGLLQDCGQAPSAFSAGNVTYVESCGAVGNGVIDDAPAIRACAAQVGARNFGGTVGLSCNKTYLLGSKDPLGQGIAILHPFSNVTYAGCGESSVLIVANGMNTVSSQFMVIYPPDQSSTYTYVNTHYRNFKIDFNGANNGGFFYQNVGIGLNFGTNVSISGVTFANNPGSQYLQIGSNSGVNVSTVAITNNTFLDACDLINVLCTDFSAVYAVASNYSITGNSFVFSSQSTKATAIEMHGFNGTAQGNSISNYSKALNVAALSHTATNLSYIGNTAIGLQFGFELFFDGSSLMRNIVIADNSWRQSIQHATAPFFDFDSQVTAEGAVDVIFANNAFASDVAAGAASTVPTTKLGRIANLIASGNIFHGGLGPCIGNGTLGAATSIRLDNNSLIDCGQTSTAGSRRGILINSGTTIANFILSGNRIANVASAYMTTGVDITLNVTAGYLAPNNFITGVATQQSVTGTGYNSNVANAIPFSPGVGLPYTGITPVNNAVVVTNGSGVPSESTTLPTGLAHGTPSAIVLTNGTGLPISTGLTGAGAGVITALGNATNSAGGVTVSPVPNANLANASTTVAGQTCTLGSTCALSSLSNALGANVSLTSITTYFDGPSVAQGTSGTWYCSGTVTLSDSTNAATFDVKLWDGTTVISSSVSVMPAVSNAVSTSLSGILAAPAANIKISVKDITSVNGAMLNNSSGNSKDSNLSCHRIG